jgi:RNA polymerase sigma factor (TIGR02999 family)
LTANRDVTQILLDTTTGNPGAADQLFPLVYDELRRLAQNYLGKERVDHTLRATELVNEAYLKLVDQTRVEWKNRAHFFAVAARCMRRILIDHARRRARLKRGGGLKPLSIDEALTVASAPANTDLIALDEALTKLESEQPEKARVVELRFFSGLTTEEAAEVLGVTPRTVWRHWQFAQAYLYRELTGE